MKANLININLKTVNTEMLPKKLQPLFIAIQCESDKHNHQHEHWSDEARHEHWGDSSKDK